MTESLIICHSFMDSVCLVEVPLTYTKKLLMKNISKVLLTVNFTVSIT